MKGLFNLQESYVCTCAECKEEILVKPSEFMQMGFNIGSTVCSKCSKLVHFEIMPDIHGTVAKSDTWYNYLTKINAEFIPKGVQV